MGCFCPFLFFGVNYLEYIYSSYFKGFWAISPTILAKNEVEVVENRQKMVSADTIFAPFFGQFGPQHGPIWAQTGPFGPTIWSIVVVVEKSILKMLKSAVFNNTPKLGQKTFIRDYLSYLFPG